MFGFGTTPPTNNAFGFAAPSTVNPFGFPPATPSTPTPTITMNSSLNIDSTEEVEVNRLKLIPLFFSSVEDPNEMLKWVKEMRNASQYSVLFAVGEQSLQRMNVIDEERMKRENRLAHVNSILQQFSLLTYLNPEQRQEKRALEMERELNKLFPKHCTLSAIEIQNLKLEVAKEMLHGAWDKKEKTAEKMRLKGPIGTKEERTLNEIVSNVLDICLSEIALPDHIFALSTVAKSRNASDISTKILKKCQVRVNKLKLKFDVDSKLKLELDVINEEKERLKKIKKELPIELQRRTDEIKKKVENKEADLDLNSNALDPRSWDSYDSLTLKIGESLIQSVTEVIDDLVVKNKLDPKIAELKNGPLKEHVSFIVDENDDEEANMKNPYDIVKVSQLIAKYSPELEIALSKKVRARIEELVFEKEERESVSGERKNLIEQRDKLLAEWKVLESERILKLELDAKIASNMPSYCHRSHEDLSLQNAKLAIDGIVNTTDDSVKNAELKILIDETANPEHLNALAQHASLSKASDVVLKCGEKCQVLIQQIEQMRTTRKPLQDRLDKLKNEEQILAQQFKRLEPEKLDEIKNLEDQISKLPKWPAFANLRDSYQYGHLSLEIVQVMTNAILDSKVQLEEKIEWMYKNQDPSTIDKKKIDKDRKQLNEKIQSLVESCLQKFTNPEYLLKYAQTMQSRGEMEIVLRVSQKCLQRINELETMREKRSPIQEKIDNLLAEKESLSKLKRELESDKQESLKKLTADLEKLPAWPHFAKVFEYHQYDETKYNILWSALKSVFDAEKALETSIAKIQFENPAALDPKKNAQDKKHLGESLQKVVSLCKENLLNPDHFIKLLQNIENENHPDVILQLSETALDRIQKVEKMRDTIAQIRAEIKVLEDERKELKDRKKDLTSDQIKSLSDLTNKLNAIRAPDFMDTADHHDTLTNQLSRLIIHAALGVKDFSDKDKQKNIKFGLSFSQNPVTLSDLMDELRDKKEFEISIQVGNRCQELLSNLKSQKDQREKDESHRKKLIVEKQVLDRKRKELENEQLDILRKLNIQFELSKSLPKYYKDLQLEDHNLSLIKKMIDIGISQKKNFESSLMDGALTQDQIEKQKEKFDEQVMTTLKTGLENIKTIDCMINLVRDLASKKEHKLVISAGLKAEEMIEETRKKLQVRDELSAEIKKHEQDILLLSIKSEKKETKSQATSRAQIDEKILNLKKQLDELPQILSNHEALNSFTLEVTQAVIESARIENQLDVLRDQHVLAFKVDSKQDRWDEIRNLTEDQSEWESIKNELVGFMMKREDDRRQKIELLMKDEMYEQCIEIFPSPNDEQGEIQLLVKLWIAIEQNLPEKLMGTVQKYLKRYFQQYKFEETNELLDQVQRQYPGLISPLFSQACDMVLLNILPSQYNLFVQGLRMFKKRLQGLGRGKDWDEFFSEFQKKHKGKRRLIQMVNLVGDSCWDVKSMMEAKKNILKREKEEAEDEDELEEEKLEKPAKKRQRRSTATPAKKGKKTPVKVSAVQDDEMEDNPPKTPPFNMDESDKEDDE